MRLNRPDRRRGAHAVECAIVYPTVFFFFFGLMVGAMGVFRYIEVCHLTRECARYAAVHAGQYQLENAPAITLGKLPNVNNSYLKNNLVFPKAIGMDSSKLALTVTFNMSDGSYDWDDTTHNGNRWPYSTKTTANPPYNETNTVSVTINYQWFPELYLVGPITLTSTCVYPVSY